MAIRMALQIPNFTYPDTPPSALFERIAASAREAEASGFDAVFVMDHFYQLPMLGPTHHEMLEAYPLLGALAAQTQRVRLGTLVAGNTYRNPAHFAKIVTTLDVVSRGRAILGIGAGWFEPEHQGYGFDFPPVGEPRQPLAEALQIIVPMLRGEKPTFEGRYYRTHEALNVPAPVQAGGPAILIGGTGEQRTLKLVARYADESNWTCPPEEFARKLEALDKHCAAVGRKRSDINVTWLGSVMVAPTMEAAEKLRDEYLRARGMDWGALPPAMRERIAAVMVLGDPDTVGEFVQTKIIGQGLDGIIVNLPANGHEPEAVRLAAQTLKAALS